MALLDGGVRRHIQRADPDVELAIADQIAAVLRFALCRDRGGELLCLDRLGMIGHDVLGQAGDGVPEVALDAHLGLGVQRRFPALAVAIPPNDHFPEQHVGVGDVILVERLAIWMGEGPVVCLAHGDLGHVGPGLSLELLTLDLAAQEDDVRGDRGIGVALEGVLGQADRPNQVGLAGEQLTGLGAGLVHRALRGDEGDDPARPGHFDGLAEIVIVEIQALLVVLAIVGLHVRERDVGDHQIEEPFRERGLLVALLVDRGLLIKLLGNPRREAVHFDARQLGAAGYSLRHETEEMPDAGRRLEHAPPREAQAVNSVPHGADDVGRGVVRVDRRGPGRLPFFVGQNFLQFIGAVIPAAPIVLGPVRVERLGHPTPADVLDQDFLLCRRRKAFFTLDRFEGFNGRDVVPEFLNQPALADLVGGSYSIVGSGWLNGIWSLSSTAFSSSEGRRTNASFPSHWA